MYNSVLTEYCNAGAKQVRGAYWAGWRPLKACAEDLSRPFSSVLLRLYVSWGKPYLGIHCSGIHKPKNPHHEFTAHFPIIDCCLNSHPSSIGVIHSSKKKFHKDAEAGMPYVPKKRA